MKKHFYFFLLLFQLFSCQGQKKANNENFFMLPCQIGNKWGLVDTLGVVHVKPQYDKLFSFNYTVGTNNDCSYFIVEKDKKIKVIDWENNVLFPEYDLVLQKDGEVRFSKNGKIGDVEIYYQDGKFVLLGSDKDFKYDGFYSLDKNVLKDRATVLEVNNKLGLRDGENKIFPIKYDSISYKKKEKGIVYYGYILGTDKKIISVDSVSVTDNSFISNSPPPKVIHEKDDLVLPLPQNNLYDYEKVIDGLDNYKDVFNYRYTELDQTIIKNTNDNKYAVLKGKVTDKNKLTFEYDSVWGAFYGTKKNLSYAILNYVLIAKKGSKYFMFSSRDNKPSGGPYDDVSQRFFINRYGDKEYYLVFKKGNKYGADGYTFNRDKDVKVALYNRIPFEFDEIRDGSVVVKNGLYGIYDNMPTYGESIYNKIHIKPKYKEVPQLYMNFNSSHVGNIYQCITTEGRKIFVYANGLELYRKK